MRACRDRREPSDPTYLAGQARRMSIDPRDRLDNGPDRSCVSTPQAPVIIDLGIRKIPNERRGGMALWALEQVQEQACASSPGGRGGRRASGPGKRSEHDGRAPKHFLILASSSPPFLVDRVRSPEAIRIYAHRVGRARIAHGPRCECVCISAPYTIK